MNSTDRLQSIKHLLTQLTYIRQGFALSQKGKYRRRTKRRSTWELLPKLASRHALSREAAHVLTARFGLASCDHRDRMYPLNERLWQRDVPCVFVCVIEILVGVGEHYSCRVNQLTCCHFCPFPNFLGMAYPKAVGYVRLFFFFGLCTFRGFPVDITRKAGTPTTKRVHILRVATALQIIVAGLVPVVFCVSFACVYLCTKPNIGNPFLAVSCTVFEQSVFFGSGQWTDKVYAITERRVACVPVIFCRNLDGKVE